MVCNEYTVITHQEAFDRELRIDRYTEVHGYENKVTCFDDERCFKWEMDRLSESQILFRHAPKERCRSTLAPGPDMPVDEDDRRDHVGEDMREARGTALQNWSDKAMFEAAPIDASEGPKVYLLSATPDPLGAIAAFCRMYEGKPTYALSDITKEEREHYWGQSLKTHLKAPWESVDFHFFIEGVDRAFTHQIVRQRTAVYAQESLRFAVKENLAQETQLPPSIAEGTHAADVWEIMIEDIQKAYSELVDAGIPAEDARGLLPHCTPTRLNYKTNLRNLLEHAGNRLCTQAQFIWRAVFLGIVQAIDSYEPPYDHPDMLHDPWPNQQFKTIAQSKVFKPVCFQLGRCPFQADFDRGCTIRERVDAGRFDEIKPEEYMANPNAGRTV